MPTMTWCLMSLALCGSCQACDGVNRGLHARVNSGQNVNDMGACHQWASAQGCACALVLRCCVLHGGAAHGYMSGALWRWLAHRQSAHDSCKCNNPGNRSDNINDMTACPQRDRHELRRVRWY